MILVGNPAPYVAGAHTYITLPVQHHQFRVEVVDAYGVATDLEVTSCGVSMDEERAPRAIATVETAVPEDAAALAALDPRLPIRLRVYAGYVRHDLDGAPEDVRTIFDGAIATRHVSRPENVLRLTAESDEGLVLAAGHMSGGTISTSTVTAAIQQLVNGAFGTARTWVVSTAAGGAVSLPCQDTNRWENVDDLADRINADVYADESRTWYIAPRTSTPSSSPHVDLRVGEDGCVLSSSSVVERRGRFANRIHTVYNWTDAATNAAKQLVGIGYVTSGPYAYSSSNPVILEVRRSTPTTQTDANTAARNIAARTITRGRGHELEAIAAYWLRPGHTARVTLPTGGPEDQIVASVDFDLVAGSMRVSTRVADTSITVA